MIKKKNLIITKIISVLAVIGLLTACGRGGATGIASTSDYDEDTVVSTEIEYLGTEEIEITGTGNHSALTDAEKQEKYQRYLKEVLSNR